MNRLLIFSIIFCHVATDKQALHKFINTEMGMQLFNTVMAAPHKFINMEMGMQLFNTVMAAPHRSMNGAMETRQL